MSRKQEVRNMAKFEWPEGYKSCLSLTFDVDGSCSDEYYFKNITGALSQGDYGPKVGLPRILDFLDKFEIKATFYVPGRTAERFPEIIKETHDRGHEIGAHGFYHRDMSKLSEEEEWEEQSKAHKLLTDLLGTPPRGFRSPGGPLTPRSMKILLRLGYYHESTSDCDIFPHRIKIDDKEVDFVELPPIAGFIADDFPFWWGGALPPERGGGFLPLSGFDDALECWTAEFNHLHEIGAYLGFINHPRCIGRPSRLRVLERFLRHVKATSGVWIATQREIADYALTVL
jgi:peptidoglycan/xylan/chitin deacetylase (PgdA/CDA1 family)